VLVTTGDREAGPGTGLDAIEVEPSAAEPASAEGNDGEVVIPLGSPVGVDELRALKQRAEQPDPSAEREMPPDQGSVTPG